MLSHYFHVKEHSIWSCLVVKTFLLTIVGINMVHIHITVGLYLDKLAMDRGYVY